MTLGPERMQEIKDDLLMGKSFPCHKTTRQTGNGSNLACSGSIEWANRRGVQSDLQQVMGRLKKMFAWQRRKKHGNQRTEA